MKILFFLFIILLCGVCKSDNIWSYCTGDINAIFKINSLTVSPDPPIIGKQCEVSLEGSLDSDITAGSSTFQIYYEVGSRWTPLPTFHNDICKLLNCPVKAGPFNMTHSINVPAFTPSGNYKGQIQLVDQSSKNITCLTFATNLHR